MHGRLQGAELLDHTRMHAESQTMVIALAPSAQVHRLTTASAGESLSLVTRWTSISPSCWVSAARKAFSLVS